MNLLTESHGGFVIIVNRRNHGYFHSTMTFGVMPKYILSLFIENHSCFSPAPDFGGRTAGRRTLVLVLFEERIQQRGQACAIVIGFIGSRVHVEELTHALRISCNSGQLRLLYGVTFLGCLWPVTSMRPGERSQLPSLGQPVCLLPWLCLRGCAQASRQRRWSGLGPLSPAAFQPGNFQQLSSRLAFNSKNYLENLVLLESRASFPCEASSESFHPIRNYVTCKTEVPSP